MTTTLHTLAHLALFLLGTFVWVLLVGVGGAGFLLLKGQDPAMAETLLSPTALAVLTVVQIAGITALAIALSTQLYGDRRSTLPSSAGERVRAALAVRRPSNAMLITAALGGLVVWTLPTWCSEQLGAWFPDHLGTLELVARGLRSGSAGERAAMALAVGVSAPLFEELIFRGYLYRVLLLGNGPLLAMVGSTLLFSAYHLDPIHVVSLLPTAAFLGWLRWRSGSSIPPLVTHALNNGIGIGVATTTVSDLPLPAWVAFGGFAVLVATAAVGSRLSPPALTEP